MAEQRHEKFAAETAGEISGNQRTEPSDLTRQTEPPAAQNFEQNQDDRERNEDDLPKRRSRSGLNLRHSFV